MVVVRWKLLWLTGNYTLKFTIVNLIVYFCSTGWWLRSMESSGRFRVRRTYILVILRRIGPLINIVALQLSNLVQNEDHDDALKWRSHLSWTLERQAYLAIWRCCKRFHTNWINQNGTSFTNISSDQKLAKILEENWLNGICPNFVELGYIDRRRPRKIFRHNGAR